MTTKLKWSSKYNTFRSACLGPTPGSGPSWTYRYHSLPVAPWSLSHLLFAIQIHTLHGWCICAIRGCGCGHPLSPYSLLVLLKTLRPIVINEPKSVLYIYNPSHIVQSSPLRIRSSSTNLFGHDVDVRSCRWMNLFAPLSFMIVKRFSRRIHAYTHQIDSNLSI